MQSGEYSFPTQSCECLVSISALIYETQNPIQTVAFQGCTWLMLFKFHASHSRLSLMHAHPYITAFLFLSAFKNEDYNAISTVLFSRSHDKLYWAAVFLFLMVMLMRKKSLALWQHISQGFDTHSCITVWQVKDVGSIAKFTFINEALVIVYIIHIFKALNCWLILLTDSSFVIESPFLSVTLAGKAVGAWAQSWYMLP